MASLPGHRPPKGGGGFPVLPPPNPNAIPWSMDSTQGPTLDTFTTPPKYTLDEKTK